MITSVQLVVFPVILAYFGKVVEAKGKWFVKVSNVARTDNVTKSFSVSSALECSAHCLMNKGLCKSYNLQRVNGSDAKFCELNGESDDKLVPSSTTDYYYPDGCVGLFGAKSVGRGTRVTTTFKNTHPRDVSLFWVSYSGTLDTNPKLRLAPGETVLIKTWTLHPYVAKTDGTNDWVRIGGQCIYYPKDGNVNIAP